MSGGTSEYRKSCKTGQVNLKRGGTFRSSRRRRLGTKREGTNSEEKFVNRFDKHRAGHNAGPVYVIGSGSSSLVPEGLHPRHGEEVRSPTLSD